MSTKNSKKNTKNTKEDVVAENTTFVASENGEVSTDNSEEKKPIIVEAVIKDPETKNVSVEDFAKEIFTEEELVAETVVTKEEKKSVAKETIKETVKEEVTTGNDDKTFSLEPSEVEYIVNLLVKGFQCIDIMRRVQAFNILSPEKYKGVFDKCISTPELIKRVSVNKFKYVE